jgi:hypothetical protein
MDAHAIWFLYRFNLGLIAGLINRYKRIAG